MIRKLTFIFKSVTRLNCRFKHIKLSPLADAFNYGPNNISIAGEKVTGLFGVSELKRPDGFRISLDDCYCNCHILVDEAKSQNRKRMMVQILDDLSDTLCRAADLADCIRALHPEEEYRQAANMVCLQIGHLVESLNTDKELYDAAVRATSHKLSSLQTPEVNSNLVDKLVLELFVENFQQSGVHLKDGTDRDSFLNAATQNMQLGVEFINNSHSPVILSSAKLKQLSPDVNWSQFDGMRLFAPFYDAPQSFLRALSYTLFYAPIEGQEKCLTQLLEARHSMARSNEESTSNWSNEQAVLILFKELDYCRSSAGMDCYLQRSIQKSSLAESPKRVGVFLDKLADLMSPMAKTTAQNQLAKQLHSDDSNLKFDGRLKLPDIPYLIRQGQQWKGIERLAPYFSLGACMEGLNQLSECLFGLRLQAEPALPGELWHPDVVKVAVYATEPLASQSVVAEEVDPWETKYPILPGVQVGTIYCDFFDRSGKKTQDCHYTVRGGRHTENTIFESTEPYQYPIVVLQLNLGPSPAEKPGSPCLLQPSQVEELFHEMGHGLHSMVARTRYQHVTGTRCSTDFVEVPSTLLEHFALDTRVTCQYARHFETGEAPSSKEDVKALLRLSTSRNYGQSVDVMQQIVHSMLDQKLHSSNRPLSSFAAAGSSSAATGPPSARLLAELTREYCDEWLSDEVHPLLTSLPVVSTTHRFGHLVGYGGHYYAYLVARAGAGLIWRAGFAADPWSSSFGHKYRDCILRHGGERRPASMLHELLNKADTTAASSTDEEISISPEILAIGLFEDIASGEDCARAMLESEDHPSWRLVR